jgi:hypothetical protein
MHSGATVFLRNTPPANWAVTWACALHPLIGVPEDSTPEDPESTPSNAVAAVHELIFELLENDYIDEEHATVALLAFDLGIRQTARQPHGRHTSDAA